MDNYKSQNKKIVSRGMHYTTVTALIISNLTVLSLAVLITNSLLSSGLVYFEKQKYLGPESAAAHAFLRMSSNTITAPAVRISTVGRGGYFSDLVVNRSGLSIFGYYDFPFDENNSTSDPWIQTSTPSFGRCIDSDCTNAATSFLDEEDDTLTTHQISLRMPSDELPYIAYIDQYILDLFTGELIVRKCFDRACSTSSRRIIAQGFLEDAHMALGNDGLPVFVYNESLAGLRFARCLDKLCESLNKTTIAGIFGNHNNNIEVGPDGLPVIVYADILKPYEIKVVKCSDADCDDFITSTIIPDGLPSYAQYFSIAIDQRNIPTILFSGYSPKGARVMRCNDPACSSALVTNFTSNGQSIGLDKDIAIGRDNLPVIGYISPFYDAVYIAKCHDEACASADHATIEIGEGYYSIQWVAIAVGADLNPRITYRLSFPASNPEGMLKLAQCKTPTCQKSLIVPR